MSERRDAPQIPGFTYVDHIGAGGFADVYLYEQRLPARQVAVKVLHPLDSAESGLEQFQAEANVMAQLSGHPAIVAIYAADVSDDGRPYLVMEYCPPPSLAGRYRTERISVQEALDTGIRISSAVETAHRAGILHRDIKPHNILTSAFGAPKLTDFGIAGTAGDEESAYGMSIPWAPPESLTEEAPADVRSDVFSVAATVYSLLAGRSPFEVPGGANDNATLMSRIERQPVPRVARADVPASLNEVLLQAMAKRLDDRPASALDLATRLQQVQQELGLPQTRIEVLDASPAAEPSSEEQHGTMIKPVSIIVPDAIAGPGTLLRPRFVSGIDDRTGRRDPAGSAHTLMRGASGPVTPVPDGTPGLTATDERSDVVPAPRRRAVALAAAAGIGVVAAAVTGAVLLGGGDDEPPTSAFREEQDVPDAVVDYVPAPEDLTPSTTRPGRVTFTWTVPDPAAVDLYQVQYAVADQPQPLRTVTEPSFTAAAEPGQIVCVQVLAVLANGSSSQPTENACAGADR